MAVFISLTILRSTLCIMGLVKNTNPICPPLRYPSSAIGKPKIPP